MPLSEQEQRLLDEMERHLMSNDGDVVSAPRGDRAVSYRNIVLGALIALAGLGAVIAGVASQLIAIGVVGFLVMIAGVLLAATPVERPAAAPGRTPRPARSGASFMDRMNDRWDRRQQER